MKRALIFLIALLVTPALPGVAGAHVEVSPSTAPASGVGPETPAPVDTLTSSAEKPAPEPMPAEATSGATGSNLKNGAPDDLASASASDVDEDKDDGNNLFIPAIIVGLLLSSGVAYLIYRSVKRAE